MTEEAYAIADLPPQLAARITVHPVTGCWIWGHKSGPDPHRHGIVQWDGRLEGTHRVVYKLLVEPIPPGLELDHVYAWGCRFQACCWPAHLEPVTRSENAARGQRANMVRGVAQAVLQRVASGCPEENDLTLAAWHAIEATAEVAEERALAYLTVPEVAEHYQVSEDEVGHWRQKGYGPKAAKVGAQLLYPAAEVEGFDRQLAEQASGT